MSVRKEVCLLVVGLFGLFTQAQAFLLSPATPVTIHIGPVPEVVCASTEVALEASISNVEGRATVRITADGSTAQGTGMGSANTSLTIDACKPGTLVVYFHFGEHGSYSSNVVVVGIAGVEAVPGGPVCVPTLEPIRYTAYPTDAAGYDLCPPHWSGANVEVDPLDPWKASAHCPQGGYYYAAASLGQHPPCLLVETSPLIMACEVGLFPAWEQDYAAPFLFPNVCANAQPEFQRAKYRVKVLPDDTTATVRLAEGDVRLAPSKVRDKETFYVMAGQTPGDYRIRLEHDELTVCGAEAEGVVFRFRMEAGPTGVNTPSLTRGVGRYDAAAGTVSSSTPDASAAGHGAILTRGYEAKVLTVPADSYLGKVRAAMEVVHTLVPSATLYKNAAANRGTVGVAGSLSFVRVTIVPQGPHSLATATFNAQLQIDGSPPIDAGSFTYSSDDFSAPLLWFTKVFGGEPVVQRLDDTKRLFSVGAGAAGLSIYTRIGLLCIQRDARGVATVRAADASSAIEIDTQEDEYEIVP